MSYPTDYVIKLSEYRLWYKSVAVGDLRMVFVEDADNTLRLVCVGFFVRSYCHQQERERRHSPFTWRMVW